MILRSTGFLTSALISKKTFYILYLHSKSEASRPLTLNKALVCHVDSERYFTFDVDIREIERQGVSKYAEAVIKSELPDNFWREMLPQRMIHLQRVRIIAYKVQANLDKGFRRHHSA